MRRLGVLILGLGALAALALLGCGKKKNLILPNVPPHTTLFVSGPVDTVNHVAHLYWFGSDPDGYVVGFQVIARYRLDPTDTLRITRVDSTFTTRTDSLFRFYTPNGFSRPRFEVRAVDDHGAVDPDPAVEDFLFTNKPPNVVLLGSPRPLPDSTFASATLQWSATDPDGDGALMTFRLWLNGHDLDPHVLPAGTRSFTIPSEDFKNGAGGYTTGNRTVFLQALDDGGMASTPVSFSWLVKAPAVTQDIDGRGRLLLVDDVARSASSPNPVLFDTLYSNGIARAMPANVVGVLDLEKWRPFRSPADLAQTFKLFDAVVWYRENTDSLSSLLQNFHTGVEDYLSSGGKLYLSGLNLFEGENSRGSLSEDFARDFLGTDAFFKRRRPGDIDSSVVLTIPGSGVIYSSFYQDSLQARSSNSGSRGFVVRDPSYSLFSAPGILLDSALVSVDVPVAVRVPQPHGGLAIFLSFSLSSLNGPATGFHHGPIILARILEDFGVYGP